MFRNSTRCHVDPVEVSSGASQASPWRPTLRRIKRGLFSNRENPLLSEDHAGAGPAMTTDPQLNQSLQDADAYLSRTASFVSFGNGPRKVPAFSSRSRSRTTRSRERPKGPKEPLRSRTFTFTKQSSSGSRSRRHRPTESQGGLLANNLIDDDEQEITGPYIPKHAASDFSKSTKQHKAKEPKRTPSTTAYTPKHAASDFSKLKLAPKMADTPSQTPRSAPQQASKAVPITPPNEDDNNDFQLFLAQARAAAARTYNTTGVISPNKSRPQVSSKMQQIVAKHQETVRQPAISISQQSVASKPTSIFDKVGEYIKPSKPESMYSQRTGFSMDDKSSMNAQERRGIVGSRARGSFRRSRS
ncbi:uncharacterized protein PAC_13164 [Phialocephala subalpina]|uniref:Uncharacterized protein n=1 Tax=Phialocephala subalpina TaxID=576137 RepID=A0A1L7XE82_9HELO|nr:uncharacterized protein PAC_13164 [Phialocephala subalpina]